MEHDEKTTAYTMLFNLLSHVKAEGGEGAEAVRLWRLADAAGLDPRGLLVEAVANHIASVVLSSAGAKVIDGRKDGRRREYRSRLIKGEVARAVRYLEAALGIARSAGPTKGDRRKAAEKAIRREIWAAAKAEGGADWERLSPRVRFALVDSSHTEFLRIHERALDTLLARTRVPRGERELIDLVTKDLPERDQEEIKAVSAGNPLKSMRQSGEAAFDLLGEEGGAAEVELRRLWPRGAVPWIDVQSVWRSLAGVPEEFPGCRFPESLRFDRVSYADAGQRNGGDVSRPTATPAVPRLIHERTVTNGETPPNERSRRDPQPPASDLEVVAPEGIGTRLHEDRPKPRGVRGDRPDGVGRGEKVPLERRGKRGRPPCRKVKPPP